MAIGNNNAIGGSNIGYRMEIALTGVGPFDISDDFFGGAVYVIDPQGNDVVLTIPNPSLSTYGRWAKIIMEDSVGAGTVTIQTDTLQPIGNSTTQIIATNYRGLELQDSGDHWSILQDSRNGVVASSIVLYGLDEASGIASYLAATSSQSDARYNATEQDLTPVAITGAGILIAEWVSPDNILVGVVPATEWVGSARARQTAGVAGASMYFELYHRDSGGTETLIGTSNTSIPIIGTVDSYDLMLFGVETTFVATDRVVAKLYASKVGVGTNPTVVPSVEGLVNPTRLSVSVPSTTLTHNILQGIQGGTAGEYYHLTADMEAGLAGLTANTIGKMNAGGTALEDSIITDNGSTATVGGSLRVGGSGSATRIVHITGSNDRILIETTGDANTGAEFKSDSIVKGQIGYSAGTDALVLGHREAGAAITTQDLIIHEGEITIPNSILVGTGSIDASAILQAGSTTKGALLPRMTEAQRDAISSPAEGLEIYNLTTHVKDFFDGSDWGAV